MRLGFHRLQWRIAAWTALILLAFQVGGLFMFERIGRSSALAEVRAQLDTGERVFARLLDQRSAQLRACELFGHARQRGREWVCDRRGGQTIYSA